MVCPTNPTVGGATALHVHYGLSRAPEGQMLFKLAVQREWVHQWFSTYLPQKLKVLLAKARGVADDQ